MMKTKKVLVLTAAASLAGLPLVLGGCDNTTASSKKTTTTTTNTPTEKTKTTETVEKKTEVDRK